MCAAWWDSAALGRSTRQCAPITPRRWWPSSSFCRNTAAMKCEIFQTEMRFLAQMNHPNIVALLDTGTAEGHPYYVMEYVEGRNIAEYCADKRLGVKARLKLFLQVCDPVQYAHESLLVHRDLKPSNIRVTGDGRVKLLDFGVAQSSRPERAGEAPALRGAVGTIVYASPEQLFGGRSRRRAISIRWAPFYTSC